MNDKVAATGSSEIDYASLPWVGSSPQEDGDAVQVVFLDPSDPLHAAVIAEQNAKMPPGTDIRVLFRNPKDWKSGERSGLLLAFTTWEWEAFELGAKDGEFDLGK